MIADDLPDSEVFSRPDALVLGLGTVNRKATGTAITVCLNPAPPDGLDSRQAGFQSQTGVKTMTTSKGNTAQATTPTRYTVTSEGLDAAMKIYTDQFDQFNALALAIMDFLAPEDENHIPDECPFPITAWRLSQVLYDLLSSTSVEQYMRVFLERPNPENMEGCCPLHNRFLVGCFRTTARATQPATA